MTTVPRHLKDHIRRVNDELRENAKNPNRPTAGEYAPHVAALIELGYTDDEINAGFGWEKTGRWLRRIKHQGKMDGTGLVRYDTSVVPVHKLEPQFQAMLDWDPEAFISFYNHFNYQEMPDHCADWVREAFDNQLLLLNVPPRHNKSTLFSVWWVIWNLVRDRDTQVLLVSMSGTLATRWVGYISGWLAYGDIPSIFGRFKPEKQDGEIPWRPSKGELSIIGRKRGSTGGGMQFSVLARGTGAQILGFEADLIVVDDMTEKRTAVSDTQRENEREWFLENVMSRLQGRKGSAVGEDGRAVVIGQRVHVHDIYGFLASQEYEDGPKKGDSLWHHINTPAVIEWPEVDEAGDTVRPAVVLWEDVWPYERLMNTYARVGGKSAFYTMYQQDPMAADATLVREEWLEACRDWDRPLGRGYTKEDGAAQVIPVVRVASLDPSPTQYNGLVVADVVPVRDQFLCVVVDVKSFKADWRGIREEITNTIDRYKPSYFVFEKNIAQYWDQGDPFIEDLRTKVRVMPHTTHGQNKFDVEYGLESLSYDFETGRIRLPYGSPEAKAASGQLEQEARMWTREGRVRDDALHALWFIKFNYRMFRPLRAKPYRFDGATAENSRPYSYIRRYQDRKKKSRVDINEERLRTA